MPSFLSLVFVVLTIASSCYLQQIEGRRDGAIFDQKKQEVYTRASNRRAQMTNQLGQPFGFKGRQGDTERSRPGNSDNVQDQPKKSRGKKNKQKEEFSLETEEDSEYDEENPRHYVKGKMDKRRRKAKQRPSTKEKSQSQKAPTSAPTTRSPKYTEKSTKSQSEDHATDENESLPQKQTNESDEDIPLPADTKKTSASSNATDAESEHERMERLIEEWNARNPDKKFERVTSEPVQPEKRKSKQSSRDKAAARSKDLPFPPRKEKRYQDDRRNEPKQHRRGDHRRSHSGKRRY